MKRVAVFLALWTAIFSIAGMGFLFPQVMASIIGVICVFMMLIVSWQLVVNYIDE